MDRLIKAVVVMVMISCVVTMTSQARADMAAGAHRGGGLGFHDSSAPIGVRWWLGGQKVGVDLGLGFGTIAAPSFPDENLSNWSVDVGVPMVMHSWERVHVLFRPGMLFSSQQEQSTAPPAEFDTEDETTMSFSGEFEGEVFLADNFSVSASHGIRWSRINPPGDGDSQSTFGTFGNNFTNVGFHMYFFGNSE